MTIYEMHEGEQAIVLGMGLSPAIKERLRSLNIYPRAAITVIKVSLFRRTYLVRAGNVNVAMRKEIAREIRVIVK